MIGCKPAGTMDRQRRQKDGEQISLVALSRQLVQAKLSEADAQRKLRCGVVVERRGEGGGGGGWGGWSDGDGHYLSAVSTHDLAQSHSQMRVLACQSQI